jgi:cytoskeleton protein RodZ
MDSKVPFFQQLRDKRCDVGLSYEDVSKSIKIRISLIRALEDNELHKIPGETYIRGYIKAYANYLGLDSRAIIENYLVGYCQSTTRASLGLPFQKPKRQYPGGKWVIWSLIAMVTIIGVWIYFEPAALNAPSTSIPERFKEHLID